MPSHTMKHIAFFISGRMTCYEHLVSLLETLSSEYDISLFMSINGDRGDEYHVQAERALGKWLKVSHYERFTVPNEIKNNTHPETLRQIIDGESVPYTLMSCFYNDSKAFQLIESYSVQNGVHFDIVCKTRADLYFTNDVLNGSFAIPFDDVTDTDVILYSAIALNEIYMWGDRRAPRMVCDAFAYGNMDVMRIYCKTYDFTLQTNRERNGYYRLNYEPTLTESICNRAITDGDNYLSVIEMFENAPVVVKYINCPYELNPDRLKRDGHLVEIQEYRSWRLSRYKV